MVLHDGRVIGTQDIVAKEFAISRSFSTGSWLGREFQGKGFGREMRAAIPHLGFAGLGAKEADSEAFIDNQASLGVSRSLGYDPNGMTQGPDVGSGQPTCRSVLPGSSGPASATPKSNWKGWSPA